MNLQELQETFELLGEWEARYDFISELGESMPGIPVEQHIKENQVLGCMSQVWVTGDLQSGAPASMLFHIDGDGPIVKGLAALLASIYTGHTPDEVLELDADHIFEVLGLAEHLSPNRHVGMYAMVEKIKAITRVEAGIE